MNATTPSHEQAILDAACELFARNGFDAVSTAAIAEQAGVSKANVYHHFRSKRELYLAVLRHVCADGQATWADVLDGPGPVVPRIRELSRRHIARACGNPRQSRLLMREVCEHSQERGHELAHDVFGAGFAAMVALFREGQDRGELRKDVDPALAAMLLLAANTSFFQWRSVMPHMPGIGFADDPEGYARGVVDVLLRGIVEPSLAENNTNDHDNGRGE